MQYGAGTLFKRLLILAFRGIIKIDTLLHLVKKYGEASINLQTLFCKGLQLTFF